MLFTTAQLNAHPRLTTEPKGSTLNHSIIVTITINATFQEQNLSAYLTLLNSFLATHPSRQHCRRTKLYYFSKISLNCYNTQVRLHCFQTMVMNCINVSGASISTYPPRQQHPNQPSTRRHRYQSPPHVYYVPPPSVDKGCPLPLLKGWPLHQQSKCIAPHSTQLPVHNPLLCSLLVQSCKNVLPTENSTKAMLSLLTPLISITKSNTVTATAKNLINSNSATITNAHNDTPPHPKFSDHRSHHPSMKSPSQINPNQAVPHQPTNGNNGASWHHHSHADTNLL